MPASIILADLAATVAFGKRLGEMAAAGDIIALSGELGSGKTTLTQAIALGLEVPAEQPVTSPTFAILHEYQGRLPLYHLDLYRLGHEEELYELGLEEYLYGEGICVIEWPDRLAGLLPPERLEIALSFADPDPARRATLIPCGQGWIDRLPALLAEKTERR